MAEKVSGKKPLQQGVESSLLDYYDIMVIGNTGMGKSTTVDKIIVASLGGARPHDGSTSHQAEPTYNSNDRKLECEDLTMWMVSDMPAKSSPDRDYNDNTFVRVSLRLKNLVFFKSLKDPHLEINQSRDADMNIYVSTLDCELLSNERTKVRVLDVPGFFGHEACSDFEDPKERGKAVADAGLSNMRKVLRIKNAHNLRFRRIVYFLPVRGALNRTSQHLIMELQIMEKHFGRAIFESMVVIATESLGAYRHATPTSTMFTEDDFMKTEHHLNEALKAVFNRRNENVPNPPIKFISLFDTCEEILRKIQTDEVEQDRVMLKFKNSFCARCGQTIVEEGKEDSLSLYCTSPNRLGAIALEESTCHPVMIPKYSQFQRIVGEILHLVTFRSFVGRWPSFETMDEVCIHCRQPPRCPGCMKIGTEFKGATVQHSSSAVETYQIENQDDKPGTVPPAHATPTPPLAAACGEADVSIYVGVGPGLPVPGAEYSGINRDIFRQTRPNYDEDVKG